MEGFISSHQAGEQLRGAPDLIEIVRSAWRDTLYRDPADDDMGFFDAGGDSFSLLVLVQNLTDACGLRLKAIDVLRAPTIRSQAALLGRLMGDG